MRPKLAILSSFDWRNIPLVREHLAENQIDTLVEPVQERSFFYANLWVAAENLDTAADLAFEFNRMLNESAIDGQVAP